MKKPFSFIFISVISMMAATVALAASPLQNNGSVVGEWDVKLETPQGPRPSTLVIKQDGDKLAGLMKSPRGERALDSVTLKGNEISFTMTIQFQGSDMLIAYKGTVDKDSMKGEADFGGLASGEWTAARHKEEAASQPAAASNAANSADAGSINISGVWNFAVETQAGSGAPVFTFKQEGENLSGTYKGALGESSVAGTVKGSDVKFSIKGSFQGQALTVTYTGKIEGKDSMKGTAAFGELGEGTWTAKKQ